MKIDDTPAVPSSVRLRSRCPCGASHDAEACTAESPEALLNQTLDGALLKALFPRPALRRSLLAALGASTLRAAIASVVPVSALRAMAQERLPLEKKDVKIGFVPITCATPLLMAQPLGSYADQGLNATLVKTAGWGLIRERIIKREHDASHFLSPMPIAMTLGLGSEKVPTSVATIQNVNGQAITLHLKHKGKRSPKAWKGFRFGVPFVYSMHNFLLRYYLAEHGVNPDTDVEIKAVPPPEMVAKMRDGDIDGFLGPDPFNQRAVFDEVGFIHVLSKDIWDGHPCCAFGASNEFIKRNPGTFAAMFRAIISASFIASVSSDREEMAKMIAVPALLNQPLPVINQVLTGRFDDGLGNTRTVPERALFNPVPWESMAIWMLTQMKRWGYIKGEVHYADLAHEIFRLTDAKAQMRSIGWSPPDGNYRRVRIMGKLFDPESPDAYLNSFEMAAAR